MNQEERSVRKSTLDIIHCGDLLMQQQQRQYKTVQMAHQVGCEVLMLEDMQDTY